MKFVPVFAGSIVLLANVFLSGCLSGMTQQDLSKSLHLSPGMDKQKVIETMGQPIKNEFFKKVEEWHYCSSGYEVDQHVALFFYDGKLVASKSYSVTYQDTRGVSGSCENFIKQGNYREPDEVTEIRMR